MCEIDSKYFTYFDRVVLINLTRRPERLAASLAAIQAAYWPFRPPQRFAAIDGDKVGVPEGWPSGGGAWGCMQSHRHVLERAIMDDVKQLLVLEDDLAFRPGFAESMASFLDAVPGDWDQLMIGGQHMAGPEPTASPAVVKCVNCQRTHAYAVRGAFMRDLYLHWESSYGHCDHIMGPMQHRYRVYAPASFLVGQNDGPSDINGLNNPRRFWCPTKRYKPFPIIYVAAPTRTLHFLRQYGFHAGFWVDQDTGLDQGLEMLFRAPKLEWPTRLSQWIEMIARECDESDGLVPAICHPQLTYEMVAQATSREVLVTRGDNAAQIIAALPAEVRGMMRGGCL